MNCTGGTWRPLLDGFIVLYQNSNYLSTGFVFLFVLFYFRNIYFPAHSFPFHKSNLKRHNKPIAYLQEPKKKVVSEQTLHIALRFSKVPIKTCVLFVALNVTQHILAIFSLFVFPVWNMSGDMRPGQRRYCALLVSNWLPGGANIANIDQNSHLSTHFIIISLLCRMFTRNLWILRKIYLSLVPLSPFVTAQSFEFPASV